MRRVASRGATMLLALLAAAGCASTGPAGGPPPPPPPPPAPVASVVVSPPEATIEVQKTVQLSAQPKDASGNNLSRSVTWSSSNTNVATVGATTGLVTGVTPGEATIKAASEGKEGSALVEVVAPSPVVIASVSPAILVEGQSATIEGTGFSATPASNQVTIGGVAATVTQASETSLTVTVPSLCLPKGSTPNVRVTVGGQASTPVPHPVDPAAVVSVAVGEQLLIESPADPCLQLDAAAGAERYLVGVQSTASPAATLTPVRLEGDVATGAAPAGPLPAFAPAPEVGPGLGVVERARLARWNAHLERTGRLYDQQRVEWQRLADRSRPLAAAPALAPTVPGTVTEGAIVQVRVPTAVDCNQFATISGVVRRITSRAIFVEDQANPVSLDAAVFDQAGSQFDLIYDIDVDHFGAPGDLDGNGRIVIVVTVQVNQRSNPPLGFVNQGNLFPSAQCAASNEGEFFFMRGPDPNQQYTPTGYPVSELTGDFPLLLIHEFAHIIQGARRRAVGGQFMSSFVAEGLATGAQEVAGMELLGLAPGANYGRSTVYTTFGADARAFFNFMSDHIAYFGFDFQGGRVANAPEQCTWAGSTVAGGTPGPCTFATRLLYGVTWSLIKHAIDRHLGGPAGQKAVLRAFSEHAGPTGYAELEAVLGRPIGRLLADWAPMLYIDDRYPALGAFQLANFNLRDIVGAWSSPNAELMPRQRGFADFADDLSVRAGSTAFTELSGAGRPGTTIRVRQPDGSAPPAHIGMWVVRLQ